MTGTIGPGLIGEVPLGIRGGTEAFYAFPAATEAVVARRPAERWPEIVEAGAKAFSNIDHMVVLNGADGMSDMFAKALSLGGTGLGLARQRRAPMGTTSSSDVELSTQNGDPTTRD